VKTGGMGPPMTQGEVTMVAYTETAGDRQPGMKRDLNEANVRDVLENVIGCDPEAPAWPGLRGVTAPAPEIVSEVARELGWNPRNRHARICVGSIMQSLMWRAARRPAADHRRI
jgi:hypothetical protein